MAEVTFSILICTRDRSASLRETLRAIGECNVPAGQKGEVVVADNGSTDATPAVVSETILPNLPVRYVCAPEKGKGYAYNAGTAAAKGGIILLTDDDVRPPRDWIAGLTGPILSGDADLVAGGVKTAPHLDRPWMRTIHHTMQADTRDLDPSNPQYMVGANCAFSTEVLTKVPAFDVELGPGALGYGDDSLFGWQCLEAGYRLATAFDTTVEHHFDETRLSRRNWLNLAERQARTNAYLAHHWLHQTIASARANYLARLVRLRWYRTVKRTEVNIHEGASEPELVFLRSMMYHQHYLVERRRPRNYTPRGLVKLSR